nr:hypothetical protein [Furfurilactobacillus milii]
MQGSGAIATGWFQAGNSWYYADAGGYMLSGQWLGDYYLNENGSMATGWTYLGDGNWSYFNGSGRVQYGWVYSNGNWYWIDQVGYMVTGYGNEVDNGKYGDFTDSGVFTGYENY